MTLFTRSTDAFVAPVPTTTPPPIQDVFNAASGTSAAVRSELTATIDRLVDANVGLDDVVLRATSEIDRLRELVEEAMSQRERNLQTIRCLESAQGATE